MGCIDLGQTQAQFILAFWLSSRIVNIAADLFGGTDRQGDKLVKGTFPQPNLKVTDSVTFRTPLTVSSST